MVVTGFACVGLFSSPPEASASCDELDTTAGIPIPTTESVCVLLVISPEAKPSREAWMYVMWSKEELGKAVFGKVVD